MMGERRAKQGSRSDRAKVDDGRISLPQAARIAQLPETTLNGWVVTGLVEPSNVEQVTPGPGNHRRFDVRDLTTILVCAELKASGIHVRKLRRVQAALRGYARDFASARLALVSRDSGEPADVVLVSNEQERAALATSLLDTPGQTLIAALELRPVALRARKAFTAAAKEAPAVRGRRPNTLRAGQSGSRRAAG